MEAISAAAFHREALPRGGHGRGRVSRFKDPIPRAEKGRCGVARSLDVLVLGTLARPAGAAWGGVPTGRAMGTERNPWDRELGEGRKKRRRDKKKGTRHFSSFLPRNRGRERKRDTSFFAFSPGIADCKTIAAKKRETGTRHFSPFARHRRLQQDHRRETAGGGTAAEGKFVRPRRHGAGAPPS